MKCMVALIDFMFSPDENWKLIRNWTKKNYGGKFQNCTDF